MYSAIVTPIFTYVLSDYIRAYKETYNVMPLIGGYSEGINAEDRV